MSSTSSDCTSGIASGTDANSGISTLFLGLDFSGETADSVLNCIIVRHLTPSELRGAPIGMSTAVPAMQRQSAHPNAQDKQSTNIEQHQQCQQQDYRSSLTKTVSNITSPISSCCQQQTNTPPKKKPKCSPVPLAPIVLSSESDTEILINISTESSQAECSPQKEEKFPTPNVPLSPGQLRRRDYQKRAKKRRSKIRCYMEKLCSVVPSLQENATKHSNAKILEGSAQHIKLVWHERNVLKDRIQALQKERDVINTSLKYLYHALPTNGSGQNLDHMRQLYEQHVRSRAQDNWKFWILGLILEPLLTSYNSCVSGSSLNELRRSGFLWLDKTYSFIELRTSVSNKFKYLSMETPILHDPTSTLEDEVAKAVNNTKDQHPNLYGT